MINFILRADIVLGGRAEKVQQAFALVRLPPTRKSWLASVIVFDECIFFDTFRGREIGTSVGRGFLPYRRRK
jgi:hypothetical protein